MKHLILGTAGHIDHGKTALIKALTNVDCDTHKEEKKRGITINLGFTYLDLENSISIGVVDVPGHKDFIHTMVGGVSGIDFFLLVIAADSGIMPQTKEHINILKVLGIKKGFIAITKIDLVDEMLLEYAKEEIADFVKDTFLESAPVVEVSSVSGNGIDELRLAISRMTEKIDEKPKGNLSRLYIDRFFNVKGFGAVVTGTVLDGEINALKEIFVLPGKEKPLRIRKMERHGEPVEKVYAGDRAAINIVGLKNENFQRGMIVSNTYLEAVTLVDAKLTLFEDRANLNLWSYIIFYSGTFESQARIHLINKDKLRENDEAIVQIHLDTPCVLFNGDRFVIRNTSSDLTLGGGSIIDAKPLHHKRRPIELIESISKLAEGSLSELIRVEAKKRRVPLLIEDIAKNLNLPIDKIINVCSNTKLSDISVYNDKGTMLLFEKESDKRCYDLAIENIRVFHKRNPAIENGLTANELKSKLGFSDIETGERYIGLLLKKIELDGLVKILGKTWTLTNHKVSITDHLKMEVSWLEKVINGYGMQTPLMSEIKPKAKSRGISDRELNQYFHFLVRTGKVYHIEENFISSKIVDDCRIKLLKELMSKPQGITVSQFRDLIGGNRKIVLLLLSCFDSEEVVIRNGDYRIITEKGKAITIT